MKSYESMYLPRSVRSSHWSKASIVLNSKQMWKKTSATCTGWINDIDCIRPPTITLTNGIKVLKQENWSQVYCFCSVQLSRITWEIFFANSWGFFSHLFCIGCLGWGSYIVKVTLKSNSILTQILCNNHHLLYKHQWNTPGFFLLLKNHIFIMCSEDTIFIFHTVKISFLFDKIFLLSL